MPNSPWTETGSSISLVPSTTTIGSDPENVNYLSNQDKINLMAQHTAELAMKTSLDTLASTWSVSSTFYDNAVAAISTALINAGAPSNWATTWPDGTTSGPWAGIQTSLANLWAQVATQRTALQSSISNAQAADAQTAAIAAAATDATTKMNAAVTLAANAAPIVVSSLPTLPSSVYPSGRLIWNTGDGQLYRSTGSTWTVLAVAGSSIVAGTITAGQIAAGAIGATQIAAGAITTAALTVANFDNLISNPTSDNAAPAGGWPSGALETVGLVSGSSLGLTPRSGSNCRYFAQGTTTDTDGLVLTSKLPCVAGDQFYFEFWVWNLSVSRATIYPYVLFYDASGNIIAADATPYTCIDGQFSKASTTATAPAGAYYCLFHINAPLGAGNFAIDDLYARRMLAGSLIVDGTITASKISAGAITADMITTGTLNAANVAVTNLNASNITTGTLSASKVLFADGTALTTASRVTTQMARQTATATTSGAGFPGTLIPGLTFSVTTASTADVYTLFGSMSGGQTVGTVGTTCNVNLYVDGAYNQAGVVSFATLNGTQSNCIVLSLTGLSAGTHTFTFYLQSSLSSATFQSYVGTNLLLQRIF